MKSTGRFKKYVLQAAMLAACAATGDVTLSENVALDADADWRDQGTVTIGAGVTLDLNGHALRVAAIAGAGRVRINGVRARRVRYAGMLQDGRCRIRVA